MSKTYTEDEFKQLLKTLLAEKKQSETLQEKFQQKLQSVHQLGTALENVKLQLQEKEMELKATQEHIAKRVKDATLLQDVAEKQKLQIIELQNSLSQAQEEIKRLTQNGS